MHRFELTTCSLGVRTFGVIRSDTLVNSESPQCVSEVWEINEADIQLTDGLYPVAQEAMRRGYPPTYLIPRGVNHFVLAGDVSFATSSFICYELCSPYLFSRWLWTDTQRRRLAGPRQPGFPNHGATPEFPEILELPRGQSSERVRCSRHLCAGVGQSSAPCSR